MTKINISKLILGGLLIILPIFSIQANNSPSDSSGNNSGYNFANLEKLNLGTLKSELTKYVETGYYMKSIQKKVKPAYKILNNAVSMNKNGKKLAMVLDIDETSLSNWEVIKANDFGYLPGKTAECDKLPAGPCSWDNWKNLAEASPIIPVRDLANYAASKGVEVYFITGEGEKYRTSALKNLQQAGYTVDNAHLIMEKTGAKYSSTSDFKAPERKKLQDQGIDIVLNIGDQISDLSGCGKIKNTKDIACYADHGIKLPDPFYFIP